MNHFETSVSQRFCARLVRKNCLAHEERHEVSDSFNRAVMNSLPRQMDAMVPCHIGHLHVTSNEKFTKSFIRAFLHIFLEDIGFFLFKHLSSLKENDTQHCALPFSSLEMNSYALTYVM